MSRAFTLLEVMVAVAILGLALTVILSAQTGLYTGSAYAQHVSVATGLARCKMTEVEKKLLELGYPELDEMDEGACCDDGDRRDFTCKWKTERVELPEIDTAAQLGSATGDAGAGPLSTIAQLAMNPASFAGDAGLSSIASQLQEGTGGTAGLAQLAMSLVYPTLKPLLEASIRKVTVGVLWKEGTQARDLTIVQYVTYPQRGGFGLATPGAADAGAAPAGPVTPASPLKRLFGKGAN
jgi:general secretion pathway protein I